MSYVFVIPGTLPGLNDYINAERKPGKGRYIANRMKQESMDKVLLAARQQLGNIRFHGPVTIFYAWVEPNRRRDKDNISSYGRKIIQDALVKGGYLEGDGWKDIEWFSDEFAVDRKNPRIIVDIAGYVDYRQGAEEKWKQK